MPPIKMAEDFVRRLRAFDETRLENIIAGTKADPFDVSVELPLRGLAFEYPVRIEHCVFREFVNFSEWRCAASLRIENCTFEKGLRLADTRVEGLCSLTHSTFHDLARRWLDFRRLHVGGLLNCTRVNATATLDFAGLYTGSDAWFHSIDATAGVNSIGRDDKGELQPDAELSKFQSAWGKPEEAPEERTNTAYLQDRAIHLAGAEIDGYVYFNAAGGRPVVIKGTLDLRAKVGRQVEFVNAKVIARDDLIAVNMGAADVGGSVFFRQGTKITGQVDLRAKVGGQVNFSDATVTARDDLVAVDLEAAEVGGSVFFHQGTKVTGQVDLRAKVAGSVSFSTETATATTGVTVTARDNLTAVNMAAADVGGSVFFNQGTKVTGQVDLRAKVGVSVSFSGVTVTARDYHTAVSMFAADVGGSVFFHQGTKITGEIDLRAKVGGQVELIGTTLLASKTGTAISFEGADIRGCVFVRDSVMIRGRVYLQRCKLGGGLTVCGNPKEVDFKYPSTQEMTRHILVEGDWEMDFAEVTGPVLLHGVSLLGRFRARHLTVHGDLDLCGSVIGSPTGKAREDTNKFFDEMTKSEQEPAKKGDKTNPIQSLATSTSNRKLPLWWESFEVNRDAVERETVVFWGHKPPSPNPAFRAIDLELAEVHGRLWVKKSQVLGTVHGEDVGVDGEANFDGSDVHGDLILRSAEIKGRVFAEEPLTGPPAKRVKAKAYPRVKGFIDLSYATVQQVDVKFDAEQAGGFTPVYLNLTGATVDELRLSGVLRKDESPELRKDKPPFLPKDTSPKIVTEAVRFHTLDCTDLAVKGTHRSVSGSDRSRYAIWVLLTGVVIGVSIVQWSWLVGQHF